MLMSPVRRKMFSNRLGVRPEGFHMWAVKSESDTNGEWTKYKNVSYVVSELSLPTSLLKRRTNGKNIIGLNAYI